MRVNILIVLVTCLFIFIFVGTNSAYAQICGELDNYQYCEENGEMIITGYTGTAKDLIIPDEINQKPVAAIGESAFSGMHLASVELPKNLARIESKAFYINELSNIVIPYSVTVIESYAFSRNQLKELVLPNTIVEIGSMAFSDNQLTSVQLPSQLKSIASSLFYSNRLEKIIIPESVTAIELYAFYDNELKELVLPDTITEIGPFAFANNQLKRVELPSQLERIKSHSFYNNELTELTLPESVTIIESLAFTKNKLTELAIPESVTQIGYSAFSSNQLKRVELPPQLERIEPYSFYNNELTELTIPESVTEIEFGALQKNELSKVHIPFGVTEIGYEAFKDNSLNEVVIASSVKKIGNDAFLNQNGEKKTIIARETSYAKTYAEGNGHNFQKSDYSLLYNGNGHEEGSVPEDLYEYDHFERATILSPGNLVNGDLGFSHWNTEADGSGDSYKPGDQLTVTNNLTLYAQWLAKFKVQFDSNGGTVVDERTVLEGETIQEPIVSRSGYTFEGWYSDSSYTTKWDFQVHTITADTILYAKWRANSSGGGSYFPPTPNPTPEPPVPLEPPSEEEENPERPVHQQFHDIGSHWAQEMIEELTSKGIIKGYEDGTFRPNESIERQQVALLITRAFELPTVRDEKVFSDVPKHHPSYEAIRSLQQAAVIDGLNGAFHPTRSMTRAEMAKVLVLALKLEQKNADLFYDVPPTHWSYTYISTLRGHHIALGSGGNFNPSDSITRAEFAAFMYRAMQLQ